MAPNGYERHRLPKVLDADAAAAVVRVLVCPEHHEGQLVLALDWSGHLCDAELRCPCESCGDELLTDGAAIADCIAELGGAEGILVTFVADDRLEPHLGDVARFEGLRVECARADVELLDHLLFSGHEWRSVRDLSGGLGA